VVVLFFPVGQLGEGVQNADDFFLDVQGRNGDEAVGLRDGFGFGHGEYEFLTTKSTKSTKARKLGLFP
jgi:hypothetical protein